MKTLTIKLTAPLQSYGNEATFDRRTSYHCPSKSAVLGMVAAALGYRRDDSQVESLNHLLFATRIDQPGQILTDYQTVEYKKGKDRKLTYRDYLQDAIFVVALGGDPAEIDQIYDALRHPKFQLSLGRRANPPAGPLMMQRFEDQTPVDVLRNLDWQAAGWYQRRRGESYSVELLADAHLLPEYPNVLVKDAIGSFSQRHRYSRYRAVANTRVLLQSTQQNKDRHKTQDTHHDIMAEL